ncbi:uncharacterized protein [Littorina saxatilis]|uniref:Uncharacterized protein n=1 Tax=Littorina saxatilis TaxID=31220 RepID=A0AAN9BDK1_9CAEN
MARFRIMSLPMMPALCVSVVSTCLLVTGVFTPGYWVVGTDTIGAYHVSPFSFCRGTGMSLCRPWDDHTHHEQNILAPKKGELVPATVTCSQVVLSVGIIAFLVNNCLLLWCACVSPTQYWARNALECTISGFLHASGGTTLFLTTRMSSVKKDSHVSLSWGAYLVMVALACQPLTALFTYLAIRSPDALRPDHSSTTVCAVPITKPTASATEPGSVPQSSKASPVGEQDLKPEQREKLKGISASEDKMGSELLRMVHMYHQNHRDNLMLRPVRFPLNSGPAEATQPTLDQLGMGAMAMSVDLCTWMTQLSSNNPNEDILASRSRQHSTDQSTSTMQANSPSDLKLTMGEQSTDRSTAAKQADSPTDPKLTEVKSSEPDPQPATVTSLQQVSIAMTPTAHAPPLQADAKQES